MAVTLICPHCKNAVALSHELPESCPGCGEALPPDLAEVAERARRRQRPLLLTVGLWFSLCAGLFWLGVYAIALADVNEFISYSRGRTRFLRDGLPVAGMGLVLLTIAFGLWKEHRWARPLSMIFWLATLALGVALGTSRLELMLIHLPILGLASWYFYRKRNVVLYYEELKRGTGHY